MTRGDLNALLKIPSYPTDGYAKLADHISALLGTANDTLLIQGEAIVALEAVATSLAKPKCRALNIVTSPYGTWFGTWLKRGGVEVVELLTRDELGFAIGKAKRTALAITDLNFAKMIKK